MARLEGQHCVPSGWLPARLSILCNLLLQAPPLTETSEAVFAREQYDACLVFEAAAAAETAIMADGAPGDYDAKLASDAQALAARVLSHAPGAADSVVRRVPSGCPMAMRAQGPTIPRRSP